MRVNLLNMSFAILVASFSGENHQRDERSQKVKIRLELVKSIFLIFQIKNECNLLGQMDGVIL